MKKLIIPIIISLLYFLGIFLQNIYETPLSTAIYEDAIIISNSQGLFEKLSNDEIQTLSQTIIDVHAENLGLNPITVIMDDTMQNTNMFWSNNTRAIHINSNKLNNTTVREFRENLGHELRHAVQFAAVFGDPTNVVIPESDIQTYRENLANYQSPDSDWAMLNFSLYQNQPVEVDARAFGRQFRIQTRRFVPRIPDDSSSKTIFIFALLGVIIVIIRTNYAPPTPLSFKKCILDLHNKQKIAKEPLKVIKNLHRRLAAELRMHPCDYIELLPDTADCKSSEVQSWSDGSSNHTEIAISKKCLENPMYATYLVAKETWKVCHLLFDELSEDEQILMNNYINSILSRAQSIDLTQN